MMMIMGLTPEPDVGYRPGIRGWWAYWRPLDAIRDGDGVQWRALWRRGRLSGRLRQSEQERAYWRAQVLDGG